jgi:hypothetical protein
VRTDLCKENRLSVLSWSRKGNRDERNVPETEELAERARSEVLNEGSGRNPVSSANDVVRRSTSSHENDTEDDETDDGNNLQGQGLKEEKTRKEREYAP